MGVHDRQSDRDRRAPAPARRRGPARRSPRSTDGPHSRSSSTSPTSCLRRNAPQSCCGTATTSTTRRSAPPSARTRRRPDRPRPPASAGYDRRSFRERCLPRTRSSLPRRGRRARACSTPPSTSSTRRSARYSSPRARAGSAGSPTTPTPSTSSSSSRATSVCACCARRSRSIPRAVSSTSTSRASGTAFDLQVDVARLGGLQPPRASRACARPVRGGRHVRRAGRALGAATRGSRRRDGDEQKPDSRSSCRATAWSAQTASSSATPAGSTARKSCSGSRARSCRLGDMHRWRAICCTQHG